MPESHRQQTSSYTDKIIKQLEAMPDKPFKIFTPEEDEIIKKYYLTKGSQAIAKVLNKKPAQVCSRANKLGLRRV